MKPKKLDLEKFRIARLNDLSKIKGGNGDDDPLTPKNEVPKCEEDIYSLFLNNISLNILY